MDNLDCMNTQVLRVWSPETLHPDSTAANSQDVFDFFFFSSFFLALLSSHYILLLYAGSKAVRIIWNTNYCVHYVRAFESTQSWNQSIKNVSFLLEVLCLLYRIYNSVENEPRAE